MTSRPDQNAWKRLRRKYKSVITPADRKLVAVGPLCIDMSTYWSVTSYVGEDGLMIERFRWLMLSGRDRLGIQWSEIGTVTEYSSRVSKHKVARAQSSAFLTFRDEADPLMIPWRREFNELLADLILYSNCLSINWQAAMEERFTR